MVQDINKSNLSLATDFAGPDDPAAYAVPYSKWADTANGLLKRRNAANSAWVVEDYLLMSVEDRRWASFPIGHHEPIRDDLVGIPVPPTDNPHFRYIKLTAGDAYNTGVLTSETVTGSAPLVIATAVISLAGSPINGEQVSLINTERRFQRAGESGLVQKHGTENLIARIAVDIPSGRLSTDRDDSTPPWASNLYSPISGAALSGGTMVGAGATVSPRGTGETVPKNIGATYYMRVK